MVHLQLALLVDRDVVLKRKVHWLGALVNPFKRNDFLPVLVSLNPLYLFWNPIESEVAEGTTGVDLKAEDCGA